MSGVRLVVVRHGSTELTAHVLNGCGPGARDPGLDERGTAEVAALVSQMAGEDFLSVLTSPAARARQTAEILAGAQALRVDPRLSESSFGTWEGRSASEVARVDPAAWTRWWADAAAVPPGGTSLVEAADAFDAVLADILTAASVDQVASWLLVGHATTVRVAVARALHLPLADTSRVSVPPAGGAVVRFWADGGSCLDALFGTPVAYPEQDKSAGRPRDANPEESPDSTGQGGG